MSPDDHAIEALIQDYLDGLYHCDTRLLAQVFHPQALYATAAGEAPLFMTMQVYFPVVEQRDPPSRKGEPREERILSIHRFGDVTALVTLECSFFGKHYTDILSLLKIDQRWQIVSKVFHFEPAAAHAAA